LKSLIKENYTFSMKNFSVVKLGKFLKSFLLSNNLARQKCLFELTLGVPKSRKVQLGEIANAIQIGEDVYSIKSVIYRFEDFFGRLI